MAVTYIREMPFNLGVRRMIVVANHINSSPKAKAAVIPIILLCGLQSCPVALACVSADRRQVTWQLACDHHVRYRLAFHLSDGISMCQLRDHNLRGANLGIDELFLPLQERGP